MGEIAEYMINGDDCQECGEHIGTGPGYPRSCAGCAGEDDDDDQDTEGAPGFTPDDRKTRDFDRMQGVVRVGDGKRRRAKNRRRRKAAERQATFKSTDKTGWETFGNPYHFYRDIHGKRVHWWPSTGKWMIDNISQTSDLNQFLKTGEL